jgi:hypothetical protein
LIGWINSEFLFWEFLDQRIDGVETFRNLCTPKEIPNDGEAGGESFLFE